MHHEWNLISYERILNTIVERLRCLFLYIQNFLNHLRHLLLVDIVQILMCVLLNVVHDGVFERVHVERDFGYERVIYYRLEKKLGTVVANRIVAQVDGADFVVLLKKSDERQHRL